MEITRYFREQITFIESVLYFYIKDPKPSALEASALILQRCCLRGVSTHPLRVGFAFLPSLCLQGFVDYMKTQYLCISSHNDIFHKKKNKFLKYL